MRRVRRARDRQHSHQSLLTQLSGIFSNVSGAKTPLYPLPIIAHGIGLNITVVSKANRLCLGIAACPTRRAHSEQLPTFFRESYQALSNASRRAG